MLFTVPSTDVHFEENLSFKNPYKKIRETRKLESIHEKHFVEGKMRVENQTKLEPA